MYRMTHYLCAFLVFTVIVRYERPGAVYGELKVCFDARSPGDAAAHARSTSATEIMPGYTILGLTVIEDGCYWLPEVPAPYNDPAYATPRGTWEFPGTGRASTVPSAGRNRLY